MKIYSSKYTFLLPAYKGVYLADMLTSIKNQTYKDFICIVSDDCSPDNIKDIFDNVVGYDKRFSYRKNEKNMGGTSLVSHWNLLINMCETDYLIMASDDDVYMPNFLEEINLLIDKYSNVYIYRGRVQCIDENGNLLYNDCVLPEYLDNVHFIRKYYANDMITCEANYVYRTNIFKEKKGFVDFPMAWFSDDATHIMMSEHGCAISNSTLFCYRRSASSISNSCNNSKIAIQKISASLMFYDWIIKFMERQRLNAQEKKLIVQSFFYCKERIIRNVQNNIIYCDFKSFFVFVRRCNKKLGISKVVLFYYWWRSHKFFV